MLKESTLLIDIKISLRNYNIYIYVFMYTYAYIVITNLYFKTYFPIIFFLKQYLIPIDFLYSNFLFSLFPIHFLDAFSTRKWSPFYILLLISYLKESQPFTLRVTNFHIRSNIIFIVELIEWCYGSLSQMKCSPFHISSLRESHLFTSIVTTLHMLVHHS